jgi:hypothetical protein
MPKLDRKDIKIFGENNLSNEIVQFGSTRNGVPVPSTDPDILQALSNYGIGWKDGVIASSGVPPFEEFNTLQYLLSRELAYLQQAGFPEYSATTTYYIGKSIVREPETTKLYISLTDDNVGNALTDPINWKFIGDLENPITTRGDVIRGDINGVAERLPIGSNGQFLTSNGDDVIWGDPPLPPNATTTLNGLSLLPKKITIANNGTDPDHDIDFGAGVIQFDDGSGQAVTSALTKQFDANFALGNNAGGLVDGVSLAANSSFYMFGVSTPSGSVTDFVLDNNASGSNIAADGVIIANGLTKKKYLGGFRTDSSSNIRNGNYTFFKGGYRFIYSTKIAAFNGAAPAANTDLSVDCPANTFALLDGTLAHTGAYCIYEINSKVEGGAVICGTIGNVANARSSITPPYPILTDSSSNIQHGHISPSGPATVDLDLSGWIEYL